MLSDKSHTGLFTRDVGGFLLGLVIGRFDPVLGLNHSHTASTHDWKNDMRYMTPAESSILADALKSLEHAGMASPVCPEGAGACESCSDKYADAAAADATYGGTGTVSAAYILAEGPWL